MPLAYQSLPPYITSCANEHSGEADEKPRVRSYGWPGHWPCVDSGHAASGRKAPTNFAGYCIRSSEKTHYEKLTENASSAIFKGSWKCQTKTNFSWNTKHSRSRAHSILCSIFYPRLFPLGSSSEDITCLCCCRGSAASPSPPALKETQKFCLNSSRD